VCRDSASNRRCPAYRCRGRPPFPSVGVVGAADDLPGVVDAGSPSLSAAKRSQIVKLAPAVQKRSGLILTVPEYADDLPQVVDVGGIAVVTAERVQVDHLPIHAGRAGVEEGVGWNPPIGGFVAADDVPRVADGIDVNDPISSVGAGQFVELPVNAWRADGHIALRVGEDNHLACVVDCLCKAAAILEPQGIDVPRRPQRR